MRCDAGKTAVYHCDNTLDRDRRLSNVGREDDLALAGGANGAILVGGGQIAVERNKQ
jgi:hypothetical protein